MKHLFWPSIRDTYETYNKSKLATEMGFEYIPNEFTLLQLKQIIKYLPGKDATFVDIGTGMGIAPRVVDTVGSPPPSPWTGP